MTTAPVTRIRTTLGGGRTREGLAAMPLEMEQALREFGLMRAFLNLTSAEQRNYICGVIQAPAGNARREEISGLLDQLFDDISPAAW